MGHSIDFERERENGIEHLLKNDITSMLGQISDKSLRQEMRTGLKDFDSAFRRYLMGISKTNLNHNDEAHVVEYARRNIPHFKQEMANAIASIEEKLNLPEEVSEHINNIKTGMTLFNLDSRSDEVINAASDLVSISRKHQELSPMLDSILGLRQTGKGAYKIGDFNVYRVESGYLIESAKDLKHYLAIESSARNEITYASKGEMIDNREKMLKYLGSLKNKETGLDGKTLFFDYLSHCLENNLTPLDIKNVRTFNTRAGEIVSVMCLRDKNGKSSSAVRNGSYESMRVTPTLSPWELTSRIYEQGRYGKGEFLNAH